MIRRLMCLATFLLCASTTWAQRPLKVYISADMEGIAGVVSGDPFFAKIIASSRAGCVWLAFFETSCVAPGCS